VAGRRIRRLQHGRSGPVVEGRDPAVPRYRADIEVVWEPRGLPGVGLLRTEGEDGAVAGQGDRTFDGAH
jgi:hypothetical protein